ncbi:adenylyltransferase/cytidyltransferase family protein [Metapseudomonas resinovorans]
MGKSALGTVITYGTFDMFHIGHLRLLKRMRELGERTIVAVSTDEFNRLKGKKALIPYAERKEIIESLDCVDLVIPEQSWEQKPDDIREHKVDTFVMGNDWNGKFDHLKAHCQVVYLDRTRGVSSTELRESLASILADDRQISNILSLLKALKGDLG